MEVGEGREEVLGGGEDDIMNAQLAPAAMRKMAG